MEASGSPAAHRARHFMYRYMEQAPARAVECKPVQHQFRDVGAGAAEQRLGFRKSFVQK